MLYVTSVTIYKYPDSVVLGFESFEKFVVQLTVHKRGSYENILPAAFFGKINISGLNVMSFVRPHSYFNIISWINRKSPDIYYFRLEQLPILNLNILGWKKRSTVVYSSSDIILIHLFKLCRFTHTPDW